MTVTHSETETHQFAAIFAESLAAGACVLLDGELGAGKTCFVRGLCQGLGGDPTQVNSPTFTIMQAYETANAIQLVHIDAYRLAGVDELETIGWDELCEAENTIIAIEWPSRIAEAIPAGAIRISIEHLAENERTIEVHQPSSGETA